jgi:capsule biosynthesis phosphatase
MNSKTFIVDIDDTISETPKNSDGVGQYSLAKPCNLVIERINLLAEQGHTIVLFTARGMRTFNGNVADIEEFHRPILERWLLENSVSYSKIVFGKPWGSDVYYIDDRSLTIDQFIENDDISYPQCLTDNKSYYA